MAKRKRVSLSTPSPATVSPHVASAASDILPKVKSGRGRRQRSSHTNLAEIDTNPDHNANILDGKSALRASPDAEDGFNAVKEDNKPAKKKKKSEQVEESQDGKITPSSGRKNVATTETAMDTVDPEAEADVDADPEELKLALLRPPPVNSSYLPLPWKGRLGYACLNTYLRTANPPVFSSRTCRIASILEHRHPLKDPSQPEHATKNRPDKDKPASVALGQAYVEALGLANARDIPKMLRWNDKYGIKFMRLSSEMFPFASHDVYGYKLAPFASEALAEAGRVAAKLGHRLTTHPGQFTQLGSPRKEVIEASIRDLEYHCELLDLLKLPEQQDRDAVMILHMGGVFGDKAATIGRFKENYLKLPQNIKNRLVLENDDVCYSVHDILPVCEELNIPMVLDFHHHNIVFDSDKLREGTLDIMDLYARIKATWDRKRMTQKMHYSEPTPEAITARQRRKHNPRVATLPPCAPTMDLMIEAKDKEQAVFDLMRVFKLPGFDTFNDIIPYVRYDENKPWKPPKKPKKSKKKAGEDDDDEDQSEPQPPPIIPDEDVGMGGPENRVYWPSGMEEWLRPKKREVKPRDPEKAKTTAEKAAQRRAEKAAWQAAREASAEADRTDGTVKTERETSASLSASELADTPKLDIAKTKSVYAKTGKAKPVRAPHAKKAAHNVKPVLTPSTSDNEEDEDEDVQMSDLTDTEEPHYKKPNSTPGSRSQKGRGVKRRTISYAEDSDGEA